MKLQETWEKLKKLQTPLREGECETDTIEWIYRNECKLIDEFINGKTEDSKERT